MKLTKPEPQTTPTTMPNTNTTPTPPTLVKDWADLALIPESDTHRLEIDIKNGSGRIYSKAHPESFFVHGYYLSTHTFYGKNHENSTKQLQKRGFNVVCANWDDPASKPSKKPVMKTHHLKTWPPFFEAVQSGEKPFEIRKNDRDFQKGDRLILNEWNPETELYTGRAITRWVTYITDWEQKTGFIVMGITNQL